MFEKAGMGQMRFDISEIDFLGFADKQPPHPGQAVKEWMG